ncbi:24254_t:CDS:10 [Dentiscutata erythropus]|uniref:24254_t:CDS:1 n=1 Tax=Dentiscutata erythropus TaxID=1348616 RepID=A0A9N9A423_9GLOM|nr:24254_t:CDS:10 [Dentiscutata erythropus]
MTIENEKKVAGKNNDPSESKNNLEIVATDEIGNMNSVDNEQNTNFENDSIQLTLETINKDEENLAVKNSTIEKRSGDVNENDIKQRAVNNLAEEKNVNTIAVTDRKPTRPTRKRSYQLRALARKTLSYQKRQKCVNFFWVTIFPLLMVSIATLVGFIIEVITPDPPEYLLCSNLNASRLDGSKYRIKDNNPNIPRTPSDQIPNARPNEIIKNYNLDFVNNVTNECVSWFGRDYPYRAPYENDPQISDSNLQKRDTTFLPEPQFGYFNSLASTRNLLVKETFPWAYVRDAPGVFSGDRPLNSANITDPSQFSPKDAFNYGSGLLSMIDTQYYLNFSQVQSTNATKQYIPLPYFQKWNSDSTEKELDIVLKEQLDYVLNQIRSLNPNSTNLSDLKSNLITQMPWGIILFDSIGNKSQKQWNYTLQFGYNDQLYNSVSFPQPGLRKTAQQNQLSNAILRTVLDNGTGIPSVTTGFRSMPHLYLDVINIRQRYYSLADVRQLYSSLVGGILYPFGVSFLLPTFVIVLVKEKEERIAMMMKIHGLSYTVYYFTHYFHFYILYIIASALLIVPGYYLKLTFFTLTDPWIIGILFFIWGHIQIAMAFLFSTFFQKSRNALIVTFVIVLCSVLFSFGIELVNPPIEGNYIPLIYFVWPPFAYYRALSNINHLSFLVDYLPMKLSNLRPGNEVIPSEYGVNKSWNFIFSQLFAQPRSFITPTALEAGKYVNGDEEVKNERINVLSNQYSDNPLIVKFMTKIYNNGKVAVKDITFAAEYGTIFGLLGPNGAGKTTLINVLTGLYKPTKGDAILNGLNISTSLHDIHRDIGVCPQTSILWNNLTVEEHLLFYARIRGIPPSKERDAVTSSLKEVQLFTLKSKLAETLDSRERRRLSIAIALVGDPALVFLDEPTTVLDPESRRLIWKIIANTKKDVSPINNGTNKESHNKALTKNNRTIILATHSMEEAEVLCNKIGIMSRGTLRCIGAPSKLKQLYGRGFRLNFNCKEENLEKATVAKKLHSFATNASYEFEARPGFISKIFKEVERDKKANGIDNWGLSQTSLEEVFLKVIGEIDTEISSNA